MKSVGRAGLSLLKNSSNLRPSHPKVYANFCEEVSCFDHHQSSEVHITKSLFLGSLGWNGSIRGNRGEKKLGWGFSTNSPKNKIKVVGGSFSIMIRMSLVDFYSSTNLYLFVYEIKILNKELVSFRVITNT